MINIREQSGRETTYLTEFMVDTEEEIRDLLVYPNVAKGSLAIVIESGNVYVLNGQNQWVLI